MTTSETTSAWLLRATALTPEDGTIDYSIHLQGQPALYLALREDDWALVLDADNRAACVARIQRIRSDLDSTTVYFDRLRAFDPHVLLSDLGLSIPSAFCTRLGWDDFQLALPKLGIASLDAVPLIKDVTYVRELLELAVRDDLLGPAGGPHELIKDMGVRDRYLVGKLAPRRPGDGEPTAQVEPATNAEDPGNLEDERQAPLHEPGAEFARASGRVEPEDDGLEEIDTTNNQSLVPSSMGLTFCVAPDAKTLEINTSWGRYERVPNSEHEFVKTRKNRETGKEEETKVRVWQRIPCGGTVSLPLNDGTIRPAIPDPDQSEVRLQGTIRTNGQGERLVTLFLVNGQLEPVENKDSAWLFQAEIIVRAPKEMPEPAVFRRRPTSEVIIDDPERDRLALIYRNRVEFAVGHGVAVHAKTASNEPTQAFEVRTVVIPQHELPVTETPGFDTNDRTAMKAMVERGWLDMQHLAEMGEAELQEALGCLVNDYATWIGEQRERIGTKVVGYDTPAQEALGHCDETLKRLREGVHVLVTDPKALMAFRFANRVMAIQRVRSIYALKRRRQEAVDLADLEVRRNRSWRPFQLAFLLLSLASLADPTHSDRTNPVEAFADLLWFPTGGGKTEAYLGVAAFAMGIRRLQGNLGGLDGSRGLTVIMRYTLRLLTLQQFQRAATMFCAMEMIRRDDRETWGKEPFTLGLWVGNRVTPGTTEKAHDAIQALRNRDRNLAGIASPAQLTSCPWCGSEINPGRDIEVDKIIGRTIIHCGDLIHCDFSRAKSSGQAHPGLPVKVVDEEIYRRPPTMIVATVDKFAMMAWRPEVRNLFGRVRVECDRHGLLWPGHYCGSGHHRRGQHPAANVKSISAIRPPDLIIQDEFHLISGPLGTMVGLYETAVDELCSWDHTDTRVRPKIVASTATVRRAGDQVRNVFMRRVAVFPPSGLDVEDNFFAVQRPVVSKPGRRYLGICAPGSSRPAVLIRTYTAFLTAAQGLFDRFGSVADPYMTLVGYFNSLRELGGMKRLAEDDVQTRSFRVNMSLVERPGLEQRAVKDVCELTSRVSNQDIPKYLDQLEVRFNGVLDPTTDKWVSNWGPGDAHPIDIVLATNMLSVGVDVNRLGVMVVNGQPKGTAEYIQATSRVGRVFPGLVASVFTWARPRDLSHYETFEHYHATFYQHVEAQSVTPFSPRAMDRGLTGAMLSLLRHEFELFAPNDGAGAMNSPTRDEMLTTIQAMTTRAWEVTEDSGKKSLTEAELKSRADDWAKEAGVGGRTLVYQKYGAGPTAYPLLEVPGVKPWTDWTVPMSMREVEPGVRLVMEVDRSIQDPAWKPQANKETEDRA